MSVASGGGIATSYSAPGTGGMPYLFMSAADVKALKLCDQGGLAQASNSTQLAPIADSGATGSARMAGILGLVAVAALGTAVVL